MRLPKPISKAICRDNDQIRALIRRGTIDVKFFPMFCGSAFKNKGVQPLLDAVVDFLPSPMDIPAIKGIDFKTELEIERHADDSEPLLDAGLQDHERPVRRHAHVLPHLFGQAREGTSVLNSVKDKRERVGRMLQMHANSREDIEEAFRRRHRRSRWPQGCHAPVTRCATR
jgi:elongation factor G